MHLKEPLLLIGKSSPCGSSGFPLSLSVWSFTICLTPYNRKQNVLSASLNKKCPHFSRLMMSLDGAHGAMGRWIDPSWGGPIELFLVPASAPRLV